MDPLWATIGAGNLSHNRNTRKNARDNHLFKFLGEDSARLERGTVALRCWERRGLFFMR